MSIDHSATTTDTRYVLPLADEQATLQQAGGKGASLARLLAAGLPVPDGFHVTTGAYCLFVAENGLQPVIHGALAEVDPEKPTSLERAAEIIGAAFLNAPIPAEIAAAVVGAYGDLAGANPAVAVRSSATAEDLPEASFAGQQETYLNVSGADDVLEAMRKCWSSLWTPRAIGYRARQGIGTQGIALAVVVQHLVDAEVAGILFTVNPMSGDATQMQVSAAWGLGDAVVGGRVTPDDYVLEKESGRVVRRMVADKEVMTVRVDGAVEDRPVPPSLRQVPTLDDADLQKLVRLGREIEQLFGRPMDIEWVLADGALAIVQARPITALPPAPAEWTPPDPKGRYMRTSIVDFLPEPLSPLFATLGLRIYNHAIARMLREVTDAENSPFPEEICTTINDYAYLNANFTAREMGSMLIRLAPRLKRLIGEGPEHFRTVALPRYRKTVARLSHSTAAEMPAADLWRDARALVDAAMYHLAILQVDTLGAAAGSEGLFTRVYQRFYKENGDPPASTYLMGYDSVPIQAEKSLYDLAQWAQEHSQLASYLRETDVRRIVAALNTGRCPQELDDDVWQAWRSRLDGYLAAFGHLLYDLDFARPVPAENPAPPLETIKMYLRGQGTNPHRRQANAAERRERATEALLARARGIRGWALRKAHGWASAVGEVREDSIASIGLAYPRLRQLLLEVGRRLVDAGALNAPDDIFWLEEKEIEERLVPLDQVQRLASLQERVDRRRKEREANRKLVPPAQLPHSDTYMGLPIGVFIPGEGGEDGARLKGVSASGGRVTGAACVLHGPEDFDRMRPGGILVAKLTTPAWTPLFAMAGGVVTDIGGPLSHGSIVAREYGIPAVLGTGVATHRIANGQQITVDGDTGVVTLRDG